jgi:hypothetical protein
MIVSRLLGRSSMYWQSNDALAIMLYNAIRPTDAQVITAHLADHHSVQSLQVRVAASAATVPVIQHLTITAHS